MVTIQKVLIIQQGAYDLILYKPFPPSQGCEQRHGHFRPGV